MAGLVQGAEQAGEQVVGVESRGDADVAGHAFGEGMLALVQPAAIEREADGLHDLHGQRALLAGGELAGERQQRTGLLQRRCVSRIRLGRRRDSALNMRFDVGRA